MGRMPPVFMSLAWHSSASAQVALIIIIHHYQEWIRDSQTEKNRVGFVQTRTGRQRSRQVETDQDRSGQIESGQVKKISDKFGFNEAPTFI